MIQGAKTPAGTGSPIREFKSEDINRTPTGAFWHQTSLYGLPHLWLERIFIWSAQD
jgi:hypothetical protein